MSSNGICIITPTSVSGIPFPLFCPAQVLNANIPFSKLS
nr:MAG TPA: hypothetical protein [Caudoviricetes sp.]